MRLLDVRFGPFFVPAFALALGAAAACGGSSAEPGGEGATPDAPDASTTSSPTDGGAEAACATGALPLVVTMQSTSLGQAPLALFVPVTYQANPVLFVLDTGSPYTFLHQPLPEGGVEGDDGGPGSDMMLTPDAGNIGLGCETVTIPGINVVDNPPVDGKPVVGTLGGDRLFARSLKLDFMASQVVWNPPGMPFAEAASWPSAPFERQQGYVRVHDVAFDGKPVQLIVDTGAPHSLWLGQQPQPGDQQVEGVDSDGNAVKLYLGTVTLTMGSFQTKVPVLRAPSFPYVQAVANALGGQGGQIDGLLGLSAFPKGVVFDIDTARVRMAP